MAKEETVLADILRWWRPPNPPDPATGINIHQILEFADLSQRQQIVGGLVKLKVTTLQSEAQFWTETQRVLGITQTKA